MVEAPVTRHATPDGAAWYAVPEDAALPERVDLLLVDGPPSYEGARVREPAMRMLAERLREGALILVDDANRPDERAMITAWSEAFPLETVRAAADLLVMKWTGH